MNDQKPFFGVSSSFFFLGRKDIRLLDMGHDCRNLAVHDLAGLAQTPERVHDRV